MSNRLFEMLNAASANWPAILEQCAQVVVGLDGSGFNCQHRSIHGHGVVVFGLRLQDAGEVEVGFGRVWIGAQHASEAGFGFAQLALLVQGVPQPRAGLMVLGRKPQRLAQVRRSPHPLARPTVARRRA